MSFNAIANAQIHLRGGARSILSWSLAYCAALGFGLGVVYWSADPDNRPEIMDTLQAGLIILQVVLFLVYGVQVTAQAIKTDLNGGMIESHRLMPISAGSAITGYLLGAPSQAYLLFAVNFIFGVLLHVLEPRMHTTADSWMRLNGVLLMLGIFLFAVAIFWNLLGRNLGRYMVGFMLIYAISQGQLFTYVPGMMLLVSPALWTMRVTPPQWVFATAVGTQIAFAVILLLAATHKYRYPMRPAFSVRLGLVLLAALMGASLLGIHFWPQISYNPYRNYFWHDNFDPGVQFACSLSLICWFGMVPVVSAIRSSQRTLPPLAVAIISGLICSALLVVAPEHLRALVLTAAAIVLMFELTMVYLVRFFYSYTPRGVIFAFAVLLALWGFPFLFDEIRYSAVRLHAPHWSSISTLSPYGSLFLIWDNGSVTFGVMFQAVVMILAAILFYFFRRRGGLGAVSSAQPLVISPLPLPQAGKLESGKL